MALAEAISVLTAAMQIVNTAMEENIFPQGADFHAKGGRKFRVAFSFVQRMNMRRYDDQ
jgi:hypothetical protein